MAQITPSRKLFDLLVTRDFDPEMLDAAGKPAQNPAKADIFSFDFRPQSGKDYGTVVIMMGDDNNLDVYCADNVGKTMEGNDKNDWFQFLQQLKQFAVKNFMNFGIKNLNRLRYSMQGQAAIKEGLFESWVGKKDVSWNDGPNQSRLMIKHKRALGEGEARFRYVESLFIETADGERYKLPFKNLTAGKAMLEHVRNGGKPYDARGQHISEIVSDLTVLSRFRRANQGKLLEGDTAQLVEQIETYYKNLQHNLKSLTSQRGYITYFESWTPTEVSEESVVIEGIKHLFVTQSIDQRIEDALPIIAKIQQQENVMKEANIFEAWADQLVEGTWATPDTPEKQTKLIKLMSAELPVGADATNATEQLYDLIGDDELFDRLQELADRDANADARQVVYNRMQELANDPDIAEVMDKFTVDADTPAEPAEPVNESRLMDSAGETIEHILNRFKHEVKTFEQSRDLDEDLYHALFDYWSDAGEIPYGVQKARTGDPYEWVAQNLESHLRGGGIVGGNPDEDYGIERESADDQNNLGAILKNAGVPAQNNPAPDYESETKLDEFAPLAAAIGGALGRAAVGSSAGVLTRGAASLAGRAIGNAVGDALTGDEEVDESSCNMTEAGMSCPIHGTNECNKFNSPLQGQYGHSGKMKEVSKDISFLDRLKELSGMKS